MLTLQMLPAGCGDCLWLEYGEPGATRIVIIDGGVRDTVTALRDRIEAAKRVRRTDTLVVELLVVTHIDNDHILGIIELLKSARSSLQVEDIWFNGRPQLVGLPASSSPRDLLGPAQGDELSELLSATGLRWNSHRLWNSKAIFVPDEGELPVARLEGGLHLTLLGPTLPRLHKLAAVWTDVRAGTEDTTSGEDARPADLLGRRDTWPPVWKDGEQHDPSATNGSSIMLLAEYDERSVLLAGDGHAPDLAAALQRLGRERKSTGPLPLAAFKLPHHGSARNLSQELLDSVTCSRYLISTDGSTHGHPDHQALLRILRYSKERPHLMFNYAAHTTRSWRDSKADVLVDARMQDYDTKFPPNAGDGLILDVA